MGVFTGTQAPTTLEAYFYPELSNDLFQEGLNAVEDFFNGKHFDSETIGESLASYLTVLGEEELRDDILNQFALARTTVEALEPFRTEIETNEWVKPIGNWTYFLFIICGLSSFFIAIGYKYRVAIITFFLSFTYIELMDKTTYLNHYYFISILSFLLIFIPANAYFSVDARLNAKKRFQFVPKWNVDSIKLLLAIVYVYAGLAKLNSDWLVDAMPLSIWLPAKTDIPLIGGLMGEEWVHYAFSWFGALIFFSPSVHHKILGFLASVLKIDKSRFDNGLNFNLFPSIRKKMVYAIVSIFFVIQLLLPWRYLAYPGELFWTEEGYRFSWRVMLMEKAGYCQFKIVDGKTGKWFYVDNSDFLTPFQEKQMSFQPDFILEYAHYLKKHFQGQGHKNIEIYVKSHVALNGRRKGN